MEEAQRRGLKNLYNAPLAMPAFILPKNIALMTRHGIFTEGEMLARHEIHMENYCKVIRIEAMTLVDMIQRQILNAASQYSSDLCSTILTKRAALPGVACRVEEALAESICHLNNDLLEGCADLKTAVNTVPKGLTGEALVNYYHDEVFMRMQKVRAIIDHLETLVAADYWPVPTYYDLLFSV